MLKMFATEAPGLAIFQARPSFARESIEPSEAELKRIRKVSLVDAKAGDVYVRRQFIANNDINHMGSRFSDKALNQIAKKLASLSDPVPVIRNHDEHNAGALPIARYFDARVVTKGGRLEVMADLFWPREMSYSEDLRRAIDFGMWRESSIGVLLSRYIVDIDGLPVGESDYWPGQVLADGRVAVGIMDEVEEVIEGSFVVRGAQIGTSMTLADGRPAIECSDLVRLVRTRSVAGAQAPMFARRRAGGEG